LKSNDKEFARVSVKSFAIRLVAMLALVIAMTLAGCQSDADTPQTRPDSTDSDATDVVREQDEFRSEKWYSLRMKGAKVGHVHTRVARDSKNPRLVHWHSEQQLSTLRLDQPLEQRIVLETWEEPSGRLMKWRWRESTSGQERGWTGVFDGKRFLATANTGKKMPLNWQAEWRGFFGEFQELAELKLDKDQTLEFRALVPLVNQVGDVQMKVIGLEAVETSLGAQQLVRVDSTLSFSGIVMQMVYWVDHEGDVVKQWIRQGDIVMERTAKEIALADNEEFDLYDAVNVPVRRQIDDVHNKTTLEYLLRRTSGAPLTGPFVSDQTQRLTENPDGSLTIRVRKFTPQTPLNTSADPPAAPTEGDLSGNTLIEVQDPIVQEMAGSVARNATDPWQIARDLESLVHGRIRKKNLSQGFNSAATTAKLLEGDCTEHAVLLAALCRARKIPCRVAVGLVYAQGLMAYHMWNEVWVEDRWIPLDATLGRGYVGPGHIKVRVSDLDGIAPFAAFVPVLELIGDLEIEIREVE
jgi:hypothetical protein